MGVRQEEAEKMERLRRLGLVWALKFETVKYKGAALEVSEL